MALNKKIPAQLFVKRLLAIGCLLCLTLSVLANGLTRQGYKQSVTTVDASMPFVSAEGQFSIALPQNVSSAGPLTSKTPTRSLSGMAFTWRMTEGQFGVTFADGNPPIDQASAQQVLNEVHDAVLTQAKSADGSLLKDEPLQTPYSGDELRFSLPQSVAVFRIFVIGNRVYQVLLNIPNDQSA